jgi:uncharacterized protein (DUF924 family)
MLLKDSDRVSSILTFWFGDEANHKEQAQIWWSKNLEIDQTIINSFQQDLEEALLGNYDYWQDDRYGTLAFILLLDQFSRHIYRGKPQAFLNDSLALTCARNGIKKSFDQGLSFFEKVFFYMPFEHSENVDAQRESVKLFSQLLKTASMEYKDVAQRYYECAQRHLEIIERFGHFPHRNVLLNRASTQEELTFLQEPSSSF